MSDEAFFNMFESILQKLDDLVEDAGTHKNNAPSDEEPSFMLEGGPNVALIRHPKTHLSHDELWLDSKNEKIDRDVRSKHFPADALGDLPWNILVDLHISRIEGRSISITSACYASLGPNTTALRHLTVLEHIGLIVREEDSNDQRRAWVALSDDGAIAMAHYIEEKKRRKCNVRPRPRLHPIE